MSEPRPRAKPVQRAELEVMQAEIRQLKQMQSETHDMMKDMHKALMHPYPGHDKSLLDRMATVTINVESGGRVSIIVIKIAALLAAIGALWAAVTSGVWK